MANKTELLLLQDIRERDKEVRELERKIMELKIQLHKYKAFYNAICHDVKDIQERELNHELDTERYCSEVFGIN